MYDYATWNMYEQIVSARRQRLQVDSQPHLTKEGRGVTTDNIYLSTISLTHFFMNPNYIVVILDVLLLWRYVAAALEFGSAEVGGDHVDVGSERTRRVQE
jgi:hypothetical protein